MYGVFAVEDTGEDPKVDKNPLEKIIAKAKAIKNDEEYTGDSFESLQEAIAAAESALATIKTEEN